MFVSLSKPLALIWGSQVVQVVKNLSTNAKDVGSIPGWGRYPGGRHDNPLKYTYLENPMDRGAWQTAVHGVTKSWTWLKRLSHGNTFIHHIPWLSFARRAIVPCTHPTLGLCTPSLLLLAQGKFQIRHVKRTQDLQCMHPSTHSEDMWKLRLGQACVCPGKTLSARDSSGPAPPRGIWHWHCPCVSGYHHVGSLAPRPPPCTPLCISRLPRTSTSSHCPFKLSALSPFWKCFLALQWL